MTLSYEQLATPVTEEEAEAALIERLAELGFSSKGWQSGSPQLTIVKAIAWLEARRTESVTAILNGLFNETSTGEFLRRLSKSVYDNTRKPAVAFRYRIRHTTAPGEGPHTVSAGDLVVSNGTYLYRNIEGGVLTSAAQVDLVYEAEIPGSAPIAADGTISTLITTVAGVTVSQPANSTVQAGADEESDPALRLRNTTRWGRLSIAVPADGYRNIALGIDGIGRCEVNDQNPRGPHTIDVYIAGSNGPAGSGLVAAAQAAIDSQKSVTANVLVLDANVVTLHIVGIVYYRSSNPEAPTAVDAAISAYVNTLRIGGDTLTSSLRGVTLDGIHQVIRNVPGVLNVDLTNPTNDVVLNPFAICVANVSALLKQAI